MNSDSDLPNSMPSEEPVPELKWELLSSETVVRLAVDMLDHQLDSLIAQTWDASLMLRSIASVPSMQSRTLLLMQRKADDLLREVNSLQRILHASLVVNSLSTPASRESSIETSTVTQLGLNFSEAQE